MESDSLNLKVQPHFFYSPNKRASSYYCLPPCYIDKLIYRLIYRLALIQNQVHVHDDVKT